MTAKELGKEQEVDPDPHPALRATLYRWEREKAGRRPRSSAQRHILITSEYSARIRQARPSVAMAGYAGRDDLSLNFDGHLVISESRRPAYVAPCLSTVTITSRPFWNASGTSPV